MQACSTGNPPSERSCSLVDSCAPRVASTIQKNLPKMASRAFIDARCELGTAIADQIGIRFFCEVEHVEQEIANSVRELLESICERQTALGGRPRREFALPRLEQLETRLMPATLNVFSSSAIISTTTGGLTLPEALELCNGQLSVSAISTTQQGEVSGTPHTSGGDTINLSNIAGQTITLTSVDNYWYGPNGLPYIASTVTIAGNGVTLQRSTAANTPVFRFFYVSGGISGELPTGNLTLQNLTLSGGAQEGGNGAGRSPGAAQGWAAPSSIREP